MKILYGVVGEGMGHAIRSRVVIDHLLTHPNYEIQIMTSGRAHDFLSRHFSGVNRIHGFHLIYEENRVRRGKTLWSNICAAMEGLPRQIAAYFEILEKFEPEVVISDFESWTYLFAKVHGLPILSIDNMQILNRCKIPIGVIGQYEADFNLARAFVKAKLPLCDAYFITSFFRPSIRRRRTKIFPPILRPEILRAKRTKRDHLLVYQTAEGHSQFEEALRALGLECRIYGLRREIKEEQTEGNLRFRPFSEAQFVADLASCQGVIAGGGFTLMGEAVYLHKPMLAVPLRRQFEQILNARYLEREGYGMFAENLDNPRTVKQFMTLLPTYEDNLKHYSQDGNTLLFGALDEFLSKI